MQEKHRILLIGGSSHAGKSTLAQLLATRLGWSYRSTDKLARHPGRPWQTKPRQVPQHVAEHYLFLSANELISDVLRHYRDNVWPLLRSILISHSSAHSTERLVIEGSAILPELVVTLPLPNIRTIWLTANNEIFAQRIYETSQYRTKSSHEKKMIDKFLARTWLFNERIIDTVKQLGLRSTEVENASNVEELERVCFDQH